MPISQLQVCAAEQNINHTKDICSLIYPAASHALLFFGAGAAIRIQLRILDVQAAKGLSAEYADGWAADGTSHSGVGIQLNIDQIYEGSIPDLATNDQPKAAILCCLLAKDDFIVSPYYFVSRCIAINSQYAIQIAILVDRKR